MTHILDRPVWSALDTAHASFAEGDLRARRFVASIGSFAGTVDDRPESLAQLAFLARCGGALVLLQADPLRLPDAIRARRAEGVQMVADADGLEADDPRIERLGIADAAEMLELARAASPGPFTIRALELGDFWGIRVDGRLVAMAGERLRQPGYTELSGVCTLPEARGQGLARSLSLHVAAQIRRWGDVPYLHAYATNTGAIRLYESIGFKVRSTMHVAMVDPLV